MILGVLLKVLINKLTLLPMWPHEVGKAFAPVFAEVTFKIQKNALFFVLRLSSFQLLRLDIDCVFLLFKLDQYDRHTVATI